MNIHILLFSICILVVCTFSKNTPKKEPKIVSRADWRARSPKKITDLTTPVEYVIIHHSESPGACTTNSVCESSMRSMQNYHMDTKKWDDIGYNFAVGGDNCVYEGRGWRRVGAHASTFNNKSIGICTIGNWENILPPTTQLEAIKDLIAYGVTLGRIASNYKLIGHRQAKSTDCPGDALYNEIKTWPNWVATP